MIIAINGEIIDTEDIYKIGKIKSSYQGGSLTYFEFMVEEQYADF